jgi:hypothetical protein
MVSPIELDGLSTANEFGHGAVIYRGLKKFLLTLSKTDGKVLEWKELRPLGSVVEHSLHTRGVNGSNPLAGTNIIKHSAGEP